MRGWTPRTRAASDSRRRRRSACDNACVCASVLAIAENVEPDLDLSTKRHDWLDWIRQVGSGLPLWQRDIDRLRVLADCGSRGRGARSTGGDLRAYDLEALRAFNPARRSDYSLEHVYRLLKAIDDVARSHFGTTNAAELIWQTARSSSYVPAAIQVVDAPDAPVATLASGIAANYAMASYHAGTDRTRQRFITTLAWPQFGFSREI